MINLFRRFSRLHLIVIFVVILLFIVYFFNKMSMDSSTVQNISPKDIQALTEQVGKLILLPSDEVPTVATVSDPEALEGQSFFAEAKKGDKVLIYTNTKKAVLYRPGLNKIITVAPITGGNTSSNASQ